MTMTSSARDPDEMARLFADIASQASVPIMEIYHGHCEVLHKTDGSPVTLADTLAETIILTELARLWPDIPVIAEEAAASGLLRPPGERFILVDPLDGTKEFIRKTDEFTVNIALIDHGVPMAGAVYAPARDQIWFGGRTAWSARLSPGEALDNATDMRPIHARTASPQSLIAAASRSHLDDDTLALLKRLAVTEQLSAGSSLKFCLLAEGQIDIYPRFGPTMEWDTAAGHAVLSAAGGLLITGDGEPFLYGKCARAYQNGAFIALGDPALKTLVFP